MINLTNATIKSVSVSTIEVRGTDIIINFFLQLENKMVLGPFQIIMPYTRVLEPFEKLVEVIEHELANQMGANPEKIPTGITPQEIPKGIGNAKI